MRIQGGKLNGWSEKVEIFVTNRSKYLQKRDQNIIFLSEAVHGEIITWNNQKFEEGYLSHPKYLGSTVWFTIQLIPKSCYFWLNYYCFLLARLWACNQLAPKYVKESESAFQIFLSETNEPKNETWRLNFPIDTFLKRKQHSALVHAVTCDNSLTYTISQPGLLNGFVYHWKRFKQMTRLCTYVPYF